MTEKARTGVRTSPEESAKRPWAEIGERLAYIRSGTAQPVQAAALGVHATTYGRLERGEREVGADVLARLADAGWNIGWVVTGQGPERLSALQDKGLEGTVGAKNPSSQSVVSPHLKMALSMVEDALAQKQAYLPPGRRVDAAVLVCELLAKGLPEAEVVALAGQTVGMLIEGNGGRDAGKAPTGSEA